MGRELPASRAWIVRSLVRVAELGIPEGENQSLLMLLLLLHQENESHSEILPLFVEGDK